MRSFAPSSERTVENFVMAPAQIFVLSSLFAALGAYLAALQMPWVFALALFLIFYLLGRVMGGGKSKGVFFALSFVFLYLMGAARLNDLAPDRFDLSQLRSPEVTFCGRVISSKSKETAQGLTLTLEVSADRLLLPYAKKLSGNVLVNAGPYTVDSDNLPSWGKAYLFSGRLFKPRPRVFSFEYDEQKRLLLKNIFCQVNCSADGVQLSPYSSSTNGQCNSITFSPLTQMIDQIRRRVVLAHIRVLGDERGRLLTSMVLGDRAVSLSDSLKESFARVGLSHLLAASGLNLTIIVGAVLFCFNLKGRRSGQKAAGVGQALGALVCVLFFLSLAGASPSVTRATIMSLLLLWAGLTFRRLAPGSALAGALWLVLLCDPLSVLDVGLQLSYGATFGIIYFYPFLRQAWPAKLLKSRLAFLAAIGNVVTAAQLAVLPVQIYVFQKISTLVLPANIIAEPLVAPITIMGFISSFAQALTINFFPELTAFGSPAFGLIVRAADLVDFFAGYLIDLLLAAVRLLGQFPLSYIILARPQPCLIIIYYAVLLIALVLGYTRPVLGAALALAAALILTGQSFLDSSCLEVLVTENCVMVRSDQEQTVQYAMPARSIWSINWRKSGLLPAYHRDFAAAYWRSLRQKPIVSNDLIGLATAGGEFKVGPLFNLAGVKCPLVNLSFVPGAPVAVNSAAPSASMVIEECQGTRFYRIKRWGFLVLQLSQYLGLSK